jgi:hypothetical protein
MHVYQIHAKWGQCLLMVSWIYLSITTGLVVNVVKIAMASSHPCKMVVFVLVQVVSYTCQCPTGFEGQNCEQVQLIKFV